MASGGDLIEVSDPTLAIRLELYGYSHNSIELNFGPGSAATTVNVTAVRIAEGENKFADTNVASGSSRSHGASRLDRLDVAGKVGAAGLAAATRIVEDPTAASSASPRDVELAACNDAILRRNAS